MNDNTFFVYSTLSNHPSTKSDQYTGSHLNNIDKNIGDKPAAGKVAMNVMNKNIKDDGGGSSSIVAGLNDVLLGRGSGSNNHIGNIRFREFVDKHQEEYHNSCKSDKPLVAMKIVYLWKTSKPHKGRFLRLSRKTGTSYNNCGGASFWDYHEISDEIAMKKVAQRLREGKQNNTTRQQKYHTTSHRSSFSSSSSKFNKTPPKQDFLLRHSAYAAEDSVNATIDKHNQSFIKSYLSDSKTTDTTTAVYFSSSGNRDGDVTKSLAELSNFFRSSPAASSLSSPTDGTDSEKYARPYRHDMGCDDADSTKDFQGIDDYSLNSLLEVEGDDKNAGSVLPLAASLVEFFEGD